MDAVLRNKAWWRSRRGMAELDVVLLPFVEERLSALTEELQQAYLEFIDCEDWQLFDWLQGRDHPADPRFVELVRLLQLPNAE